MVICGLRRVILVFLFVVLSYYLVTIFFNLFHKEIRNDISCASLYVCANWCSNSKYNYLVGQERLKKITCRWAVYSMFEILPHMKRIKANTSIVKNWTKKPTKIFLNPPKVAFQWSPQQSLLVWQTNTVVVQQPIHPSKSYSLCYKNCYEPIEKH